LHAVLGSSGEIGGFTGGSGGPGNPGGFSGGGFGGGGFGGAGDGVRSGIGGGGVSWPNLPFVDIARSEPVVAAVAVGQTLAFAALLLAWLVVAFGPSLRSRAILEPETA
jgi:hypothetical protein